MKWLIKTPTSPHQVLAIINEANQRYQDYKKALKREKASYEIGLYEKGIFVGSKVKVLSKGTKDDLRGQIVTITKISGRNVSIKTKCGKCWRLNNFDFEKIE